VRHQINGHVRRIGGSPPRAQLHRSLRSAQRSERQNRGRP
jgi:hypothetical protein